MSAISVFAKRNGILFPCKAFPERDGCAWKCGNCSEICCRVSFGMMNGNWRCACGAELDITVDGEAVDLRPFVQTGEAEYTVRLPTTEAMNNKLPNVYGDQATQEFFGKLNALAVEGNDEDFLKKCGIAAEPNTP